MSKRFSEYRGLYRLTRDGDVYTVVKKCRGGNNIRTLRERRLVQRPNNKGYLCVNLSKGGKYKTFSVHRLVYEEFFGEIPSGSVVHHKDGNRSNNHIENLVAMGYGEHSRMENRKLSKEIENYIFWIYTTGEITYKKLESMFGVSDTTIATIVNRGYAGAIRRPK